MNRDKPDITTQAVEALSVFRGIYKRVAAQLDVDPSYVSRVARGERRAPFVSEALRREIQRVLGQAGLQDGNGKTDGHNHNHNGVDGLLTLHNSDGHAKNGQAVSKRKEKKSASPRRKK